MMTTHVLTEITVYRRTSMEELQLVWMIEFKIMNAYFLVTSIVSPKGGEYD